MKNKINIAVCDDEEMILNSEFEMLKSVLDKKSIVYEIKKFNNPLDMSNSDVAYDMVFLDIEMDNMNGIDLARKVLEKNKECLLFFVTNFQVYLDSAFDVNAFRFLPKPLEIDRLERGINSGLMKIKERTLVLHTTELQTKVPVEIPITSIMYLENSNRHTHIVTTNRDFVAREPFSVLKNKILSETNYFAESNQSVFLNLKYVTYFDRLSVVVSYGNKKHELYMSRRKFKNFDTKMFEIARDL